MGRGQANWAQGGLKTGPECVGVSNANCKKHGGVAAGNAREEEVAPAHWTAHKVQCRDEAKHRRKLAEEIMGTAANKPVQIRGLVVPRWRATTHPAAPVLREHARKGCPVDAAELEGSRSGVRRSLAGPQRRPRAQLWTATGGANRHCM